MQYVTQCYQLFVQLVWSPQHLATFPRFCGCILINPTWQICILTYVYSKQHYGKNPYTNAGFQPLFRPYRWNIWPYFSQIWVQQLLHTVNFHQTLTFMFKMAFVCVHYDTEEPCQTVYMTVCVCVIYSDYSLGCRYQPRHCQPPSISPHIHSSTPGHQLTNTIQHNTEITCCMLVIKKLSTGILQSSMCRLKPLPHKHK